MFGNNWKVALATVVISLAGLIAGGCSPSDTPPPPDGSTPVGDTLHDGGTAPDSSLPPPDTRPATDICPQPKGQVTCHDPGETWYETCTPPLEYKSFKGDPCGAVKCGEGAFWPIKDCSWKSQS